MTKKTLIIGTGLTGQSMMKYFQSKDVEFNVFDTRKSISNLQTLKHLYPNVAFYLKDPTVIDWSIINQVCISPGISPSTEIVTIAKQHQLPIIGDLELFARRKIKKPIIAITGTNGKSTLVTLVTTILEKLGNRVALAGNIGEPMLNVNPSNIDYCVLEISSFQLYYQDSFQTDISCILNISEDHIDWHGSYVDYIKAKQKIYSLAKHSVFNADDKKTYPTNTDKATAFSLSGNPRAKFTFDKNTSQILRYEQPLLHTDKLKISGTHNFEDILAALTIIDELNVDINEAVQTIKTFEGLPHRTQFVRKLEGITWINDSKGTNVGATFAAIKGLSTTNKGKIIWLAGGQGKGADFSPLAHIVNEEVRHSVLFGEDKQKIAGIFKQNDNYSFATDLIGAISQARQHAKTNDIVLFSPACASFDMFANYIRRGEAFMHAVNQIS